MIFFKFTSYFLISKLVTYLINFFIQKLFLCKLLLSNPLYYHLNNPVIGQTAHQKRMRKELIYECKIN
jgi:hypothetical protein